MNVTGSSPQEDLEARMPGRVLHPDGPGYAEARTIFNGMIDKRPALIAQCSSADDVRHALAVARAHGLAVSVRGGGHNVAGHALCDGGVMIDLSPMRSVEVDPGALTATAQPGATWLDLDGATVPHRLVTTGGTVGSTGIAGLTLGGGIGHLMGSYGLTCDNLISAEVVTADGTLVHAGPEGDPELLWGLRGGGGNFGVVTSFRYQLYPLGPLYGGLLLYGWDDARAALRLYREVTTSAPDALTCSFVGLTDPSSGARLAGISVCWNGDADAGAEATRALRDTIPVAAGELRAMTYPEVQGIFAEIPFGLRHYWKGHFLGEMPDAAVDHTVETFEAAPSTHSVILIEAPHGAASRVPAESAAYAHRDARYNVSAFAIWDEATGDEVNVAWARAYAAGLEPYARGRAEYLNYMGPNEPPERIRAAFGDDAYQRLTRLKDRYDPDNVFRNNQNIPPTAAP